MIVIKLVTGLGALNPFFILTFGYTVISMKILAYSKALYSTWLYYSPDAILFDAGENVSSIMGNKSFAINRIFLSHGHTDHIAGLVGLINIRNNAMGNKAKPLTVYYPEDNFHVCELMNYLHRTNTNLRYNLEWKPLQPGSRVQVFGDKEGRNSRYVKAFSTEHSRHERSLGYNVVEVRQRLKPRYRDLSQKKIKQRAEQGKRSTLMEKYHKRLFTYGGDSVPLNPEDIKDTDILCHDATFLEESDRKEYKHATLEEAITVAREANVQKELLALHISSRYNRTMDEYRSQLGEKEFGFRVTLLDPGRIYRRS